MEYEGSHSILKNPSWWERRTNLERRTMIVVFILFLLCIGLVICLLMIIFKSDDLETFYPYQFDYEMQPFQELGHTYTEPHQLCMEPGCIHASSNTLKYLDTGINPCDNFYKFSCGGFLNKTHISENKPSITPFDINHRKVQSQLKTIFEEPTSYKDIKPVGLIKKLFHLCMDTATIDKDNLFTIKSLIHHIGGWPVLESYFWNENDFDWKNAIFKLRRLGFNENYLLTLDVSAESYNSSQHVLALDTAFLEPEEELFLSEGLGTEFANIYFNYMVDISTLFGANFTFALSEMKAALEFEIALAKISGSQRRDVFNSSSFYRTMSIAQLQSRYPSIPWVEYINGIVDLSEYKITFQDQVIVRVPQYFHDLENLIRWSSKRVIANYLVWRVVKYSINYLTTQLRDRQATFYRDAYSFLEREPRWRECVNLVTNRMPFAVGYIFTERYIEKETKDIVFDMVTNLRSQIIELLKSVDWMDDITRVNGYDKAQAMTMNTAYSEDYLSIKKLQKYYIQLEFTKNNYLKSVLNLALFKKDKYFKKLMKYGSHHREWEENDYSVGYRPYYSITKNKLYIPNGILQGIFFGTDKPQYFNYGSLGFLIGHEMVHGFDDNGRQFDKYGNPSDWWTEFTKRAFSKKARCLYSQYRNHTVSEVELYANGITNHEVNFANQGGIKAAYFAYNVWVERFGHEFQLPSLNQYTPPQLFWISAAQTQCEKYQSKFMKEEGYTEESTPAQYRLNEAFSNIEYFSRDFHCHLGSNMNPARKCHVW